MIYGFSENCALAQRGLLERIYALRHRVFVQELGWEALRRSDRLEKDAFDDPHALHLAFVAKGNVLAYTRLLTTIRPHLLSNVYPVLMQGRKSPRSADVWEWTRLCAIPDPASGRATPMRAMMTAVAEICVHMGLRSLVAQSDPTWINRLKRLGWEARPIALPMIYDGAIVVPLEARASEETIAQSRRRLGVCGSILDLSFLELPEVTMVA